MPKTIQIFIEIIADLRFLTPIIYSFSVIKNKYGSKSASSTRKNFNECLQCLSKLSVNQLVIITNSSNVGKRSFPNNERFKKKVAKICSYFFSMKVRLCNLIVIAQESINRFFACLFVEIVRAFCNCYYILFIKLPWPAGDN